MKLFETIKILNQEINEFQDYDSSQDWNPEREDRDPNNEEKRITEPKDSIEKKTMKFVKDTTKETPDYIEELPNQFGDYKKNFIKFYVIYFKNHDLSPIRIANLGTEKQFNSVLKEFGKKISSKKMKEKGLKELIEDNEITIKSTDFKDSFLKGIYIFNKNNNYVVIP